MMPNRIIVSGIYRSGTSLNADLIHKWGAYGGREDDIFQDKYGYMEHLALQKLNDELLNNNSRVPVPVDQMLEKAQDPILTERALQILDVMDKEAEQNKAISWVWKDPRLPLVMPFKISNLTFDAPVLVLLYLLVAIIANGWVGAVRNTSLNNLKTRSKE